MTYTGKLSKYQTEAVDFIKAKKSTLIGYDLGLGKTHISMAYCEDLKPKNNDVLVLCPASIVLQWKEEIEKFTDSKVTIINGVRKKRCQQWEERSYYYITNYEKLRTDNQIFHRVWGVVILDECTKIKSQKAQLTRKAYMLRANKKICLSGTPVHNSPNDLYSIVNFLYPYLLGNYWQFANRYIDFEPREINGRTFNEIKGFQNLDELHNKIKMFFIRKKKEDVLTELPPVIYETLTCVMNPNQYNVYERIMDEITILQEKENTLHLFTALKLLSNHPSLLKETEGEKIKQFGSLVSDTKSDKLRVLMEFIEQNKDKKIVLFSQYKKMIYIISEELKTKGYKHLVCTGGITLKDRNDNINKFKQDKTINLLINTDTLAYGVNLQEASILINYDLPYSVADFYQRIGRLHRIGQRSSVVVINIITQSSIERKVLKILMGKQNMIDQIIDGKVETNIFNDIMMEMRKEK